MSALGSGAEFVGFRFKRRVVGLECGDLRAQLGKFGRDRVESFVLRGVAKDGGTFGLRLLQLHLKILHAGERAFFVRHQNVFVVAEILDLFVGGAGVLL